MRAAGASMYHRTALPLPAVPGLITHPEDASVKIVIAPDSFKESLSAPAVAQAIAQGVLKAAPHAQVVCVPMADGGEGTVQAVLAATGGQWRETEVRGALDEPRQAGWGWLGAGSAVIETATAAGLELVPPDQRRPLRASSYGVGQLVRAALDAGATRIILGLGGSSTNDGGAGMAVTVVDDDGHTVIGAGTGLYTPARATPALAGRTSLTQDGDRLIAAVPVSGHAEAVAMAPQTRARRQRGAELRHRLVAPVRMHHVARSHRESVDQRQRAFPVGLLVQRAHQQLGHRGGAPRGAHVHLGGRRPRQRLRRLRSRRHRRHHRRQRHRRHHRHRQRPGRPRRPSHRRAPWRAGPSAHSCCS